MGIPDKITLSGNVYIKYIDNLSKLVVGDVQLYLHDDAINPFPGDYENLTTDGYIKAKIFDGKVWHYMDISEFCTKRENRFSKKHRAIDSAYLCKDIIETYKGAIVVKKYRGHFVRLEE